MPSWVTAERAKPVVPLCTGSSRTLLEPATATLGFQQIHLSERFQRRAAGLLSTRVFVPAGNIFQSWPGAQPCISVGHFLPPQTRPSGPRMNLSLMSSRLFMLSDVQGSTCMRYLTSLSRAVGQRRTTWACNSESKHGANKPARALTEASWAWNRPRRARARPKSMVCGTNPSGRSRRDGTGPGPMARSWKGDAETFLDK